jgi:hypothetical protein
MLGQNLKSCAGLRKEAARRLPRLLCTALLVVLAASPTLAQEALDGGGLRVMTRNLYVGSGFNPVLSARTPDEFRQGVTSIWDAVRATDPPARMSAIGAEIAAARPHLVSLQEVATWSTGPARGNLRVEFDFLDLLLDELTRRGERYRAIALMPHFDFAAPSATGEFVSVQFRVAILARDGPGPEALRFSNIQNGLFTSTLSFPAPALGTSIPFPRAWAAVDATFQGRPFRFVATHLEAFAAPTTIAQAAELLAGPARTSLPVIVAGDLNSDAANANDPAHPAYAGFITPENGFLDVWSAANAASGFTCCRGRGMANPAAALGRRVDLVLVRGFNVKAAAVQGNNPALRTAGGLWPSDHAGVAALLEVAQ